LKRALEKINSATVQFMLNALALAGCRRISGVGIVWCRAWLEGVRFGFGDIEGLLLLFGACLSAFPICSSSG